MSSTDVPKDLAKALETALLPTTATHSFSEILKYREDLEKQAAAISEQVNESQIQSCTYDQGYIRQAVYACKTCQDQGKAQFGFCLGCSMNCHLEHEVYELFTKRHFRCDCGNARATEPSSSSSSLVPVPTHVCELNPTKDDENVENKYNHNFNGLYCYCSQPYDPDSGDWMQQCTFCEDWYHGSCLTVSSPPSAASGDSGVDKGGDADASSSTNTTEATPMTSATPTLAVESSETEKVSHGDNEEEGKEKLGEERIEKKGREEEEEDDDDDDDFEEEEEGEKELICAACIANNPAFHSVLPYFLPVKRAQEERMQKKRRKKINPDIADKIKGTESNEKDENEKNDENNENKDGVEEIKEKEVGSEEKDTDEERGKEEEKDTETVICIRPSIGDDNKDTDMSEHVNNNGDNKKSQSRSTDTNGNGNGNGNDNGNGTSDRNSDSNSNSNSDRNSNCNGNSNGNGNGNGNGNNNSNGNGNSNGNADDSSHGGKTGPKAISVTSASGFREDWLIPFAACSFCTCDACMTLYRDAGAMWLIDISSSSSVSSPSASSSSSSSSYDEGFLFTDQALTKAELATAAGAQKRKANGEATGNGDSNKRAKLEHGSHSSSSSSNSSSSGSGRINLFTAGEEKARENNGTARLTNMEIMGYQALVNNPALPRDAVMAGCSQMKAFEELLVKGMKQYIQLAKALQAKKRAKRLAQVQAQAQRDGQTSSVVNKELPEEKEPVITKEIMDIIIQNAKDTLKARQRYQ